MTQNLQDLLKLLLQSDLDFVLIGGFAAVLHGCNQTTRDIDICVLHSAEQIETLQHLLSPIHPYYRGTDPKESFLAPKDFSQKQDFHLVTDLGVLDVISKVKGVGDFYAVLKNSKEITLYGHSCRIISIEDLIKSKKALGRHRDLATVAELEAILEKDKN